MHLQSEDLMATYPVMEHFYTLQGEGAYMGCAAYFIRLGGCDVGCVWCDVKESWSIDAHPRMSVAALLTAASQHPGKIVVITGGEPAMHNLEPLTNVLKKSGFRLHIETSGSAPLTGYWDWITLSPKKFKKPIASVCLLAHELKIIVFNKSDFEWATEYAAKVDKNCKLYLQPEWSKVTVLSPQIVTYIQEHPQWQLSLQTHKYLNIP
jgi:7-carboxy-7-deazaguanine synthase